MPLGSNNPQPFADLGVYGAAAGDLLGEQRQDETEEMKRRRQLMQQMQEAVSPLGASNVLGLGSSMMKNMMSGFRARRGA